MDVAFDSIKLTCDYNEAFSNADLVIEAIAEVLADEAALAPSRAPTNCTS